MQYWKVCTAIRRGSSAEEQLQKRLTMMRPSAIPLRFQTTTRHNPPLYLRKNSPASTNQTVQSHWLLLSRLHHFLLQPQLSPSTLTTFSSNSQRMFQQPYRRSLLSHQNLLRSFSASLSLSAPIDQLALLTLSSSRSRLSSARDQRPPAPTKTSFFSAAVELLASRVQLDSALVRELRSKCETMLGDTMSRSKMSLG